jgi:hypothetical protein
MAQKIATDLFNRGVAALDSLDANLTSRAIREWWATEPEVVAARGEP